MAQRKITVVGAGNVGATTAHIAATQQLGEIVLIDIVEGLAQGKALDMAQASHIQHSEQRITGTTGKIVGVICLIYGAVVILLAILLFFRSAVMYKSGN